MDHPGIRLGRPHAHEVINLFAVAMRAGMPAADLKSILFACAVGLNPALNGGPHTMKAIAVHPRKPGSVHLAELAEPTLDQVGNGRGVLAKVLRVGVDATDREIAAGEYGAAPDGFDFLVLGHESFCRIERVGAGVTELSPGDYVAFMVRRPGGSIYDQMGYQDLTGSRIGSGSGDRAGRWSWAPDRWGCWPPWRCACAGSTSSRSPGAASRTSTPSWSRTWARATSAPARRAWSRRQVSSAPPI